ncbi:MAG: hypothetical protein F6K36_02090 [Symploca sp. SIO3C6]|nr:hypothetical protein [Symploca sp. SIO3C6]
MTTQANFILKVFIISVGISVLIRYGAPSLPIAATTVNALIGVLTPTLIVAIGLWWRVVQLNREEGERGGKGEGERGF